MKLFRTDNLLYLTHIFVGQTPPHKSMQSVDTGSPNFLSFVFQLSSSQQLRQGQPRSHLHVLHSPKNAICSVHCTLNIQCHYNCQYLESQKFKLMKDFFFIGNIKRIQVIHEASLVGILWTYQKVPILAQPDNPARKNPARRLIILFIFGLGLTRLVKQVR